MDIKTYFVNDILLAITDFELGNAKEFPINIKDLIIWDESSTVTKSVFEQYLDMYFEYVVLSTGTAYRITGILNKNLF